MEVLENFELDKINEIANHNMTLKRYLMEWVKQFSLPRRSGTIDCKTCRTISVMGHVTKILLRVILKWNKSTIKGGVSKRTCICHIDHVKTFGCVKHGTLMELLGRLEVDGKDFRLIRNLYYDQQGAFRIQGEFGEWVDIQRVV